MRSYQLSKLALSAAIAVSLPACNSSDAPAPQVANSPVEDPPTPAAVPNEPQAPSEPQKAPPVLEHSPLASGAPFVVTLKGPPEAPEKGEVELTMVIDAAKQMKVPTTIAVTVPKGATLKSGLAQETLSELPAGQTTRTFKVSISSRLSDPIRVVVDTKDPGGAFGARAERLYPAPAEIQYEKPYSGKVPPPPGGRPPTGPARK